ncbi:MAG: hydrogenase maturation protease [Alphaproteobacteria bacterium]|nr:hydrogenase maturation protease [Alphaproteobacteria bacterium]
MRLVGLGQPAAGDDGVGLRIARAVRQVLPDLEVVELTGAEGLIELLDGRPTLVVDAAVVAVEPGTLLELAPEHLARVPAFSTHGIGVAEAIGLASALYGTEVLHGLTVLGIAIRAPRVLAEGLTPEVAAAVPRAVDRVRRWVAEVSG